MPNVLTVPAFDDNYLWLIHDERHAAVVDPGDAGPILAALAENGLSLVAILLTHHHADHIGGVQRLLQEARPPAGAAPIPVYGPAGDGIAAVTRPLREGDIVMLPEIALSLSVLDVPGHTRGHIAYVAREQPWLFCGDTLFAGGCGRLFEGTPAQMSASLDKLAALPAETLVYCAHEYTVSNLRFACAAEPDNPATAERLEQAKAMRRAGMPTVPSTIGIERATNPFLRTRDPAIAATLIAQDRLQTPEPLAAFAALREWKNTFR